MAVSPGEVDAWREAAGPLMEAMGFVDEQAAPEAEAQQEAPESAAPAEVQTTDTPAPEYAIPVFEPVTLEDLEDDDDPEVDDEPVLATNDDEYVDEETRKLRAELAKAQKQLASERKQRLDTSQDKWRAKYREMYPFADVDSITAPSRREFERQAVESHNRIGKLVAPHLETARKVLEHAQQAGFETGREAAAAAFGRPTTGPGAAPAIRGERDAAIAESRKTSKTVYEHFKNMLAIEDAARQKGVS